jgi:hypothetical protein
VDTSNLSPEIILWAVAAVLAGLALLRIGRQLAIFLLAIGGIGVVGIVAYAALAQAQATRQAAAAAAAASAGQTLATVAIVLLLLLLVAAGVGILYLRWRLQRERGQRRGREDHRAPGPNATWGRDGYLPALPHSHPHRPDPSTFWLLMELAELRAVFERAFGGLHYGDHLRPGRGVPPPDVLVFPEWEEADPSLEPEEPRRLWPGEEEW